eukprot:scaffold14094_cov214-Alexandrium_tamarense.AAC.3
MGGWSGLRYSRHARCLPKLLANEGESVKHNNSERRTERHQAREQQQPSFINAIISTISTTTMATPSTASRTPEEELLTTASLALLRSLQSIHERDPTELDGNDSDGLQGGQQWKPPTKSPTAEPTTASPTWSPTYHPTPKGE